MRLSDKERAALAAVEFDPDASLSKLQKAARMPTTVLRYHVNNLLKRGVLRYYPFINTSALGYLHYSIYFSPTAEGRRSQDALLEHLRNAPEVSWLAGLGGTYQFCCTLMVKRPNEVTNFLTTIAEKFGPIIQKKVFSTQTSLSVFPTKYAHPRKLPPRAIRWAEDGGVEVEIDHIDKQILATLIAGGYTSRREVARTLGLPSSTVDDRVAKLLKRGVIVQFLYLVNPTLFHTLSFKLLLSTYGNNAKLHEALFRFCAEHRNITSFITCLGPWDFEIGVEVSHASDLQHLSSTLFEQFGEHLQSVEELALFEELKVACFPFLSAPRRAEPISH